MTNITRPSLSSARQRAQSHDQFTYPRQSLLAPKRFVEQQPAEPEMPSAALHSGALLENLRLFFNGMCGEQKPRKTSFHSKVVTFALPRSRVHEHARKAHPLDKKGVQIFSGTQSALETKKCEKAAYILLQRLHRSPLDQISKIIPDILYKLSQTTCTSTREALKEKIKLFHFALDKKEHNSEWDLNHFIQKFMPVRRREQNECHPKAEAMRSLDVTVANKARNYAKLSAKLMHSIPSSSLSDQSKDYLDDIAMKLFDNSNTPLKDQYEKMDVAIALINHIIEKKKRSPAWDENQFIAQNAYVFKFLDEGVSE